MVKAIAIARKESQSRIRKRPVIKTISRYLRNREALTDQRQPDEHEAHQRQHRQRHPQQRLDVVGQPEETAVGGVDGLCAGLAALKDPFRVTRRRVHLVPPAQADEAAPGDVFQVVEVGGEEEDRDDED